MADMDGIETVSLYDQSADTIDSSVTGLRRALTYRDVMLGGSIGLEPTGCAWHLQANTTSITPEAGDKITDSGSIAYTILSVSQETLKTRWRCLCNLQKT